MPQAFDNCVKQGGKVTTKSLSNGRYMHICTLNGKSYSGYIKTRKAVTSNKTSKYTSALKE